MFPVHGAGGAMGAAGTYGYTTAASTDRSGVHVHVHVGVRERGRASDPPFCHKTGKGWVAPHRGCYDDAIRVKRNEFELCAHESLGGGFSPPAVKAMHKHAKKARVHDRTYYTGRVKKNFVPQHTQRVSIAIVKGEGDIVAAVANRLKAEQVIRDSLNPRGA